MNNLRRRIVLNISKAADLGLMVCAFLLAMFVVLDGNAAHWLVRMLSMQVQLQRLALFVTFLIAWNVIFSCFNLYDSKRLSKRRAESFDVLKATTLGTLVLFASGAVLRIPVINREFLIVFWGTATVATISVRLVVRIALATIRKRGRNTRHMLIVGTNQRAIEFARKIDGKPELGYKIIGFADGEWNGADEIGKLGYSLVANFESLPRYLRVTVVDEVVLALPVRSFHSWASEIAQLCEEQGIITRFLPDLFDLKVARRTAEEFEEQPVITHYTGASDGWPRMIKRVIDAIVSMIVVLLLSPMLLLTAIAIKLTSPGPVFFTQERLGLNKRRFRMFKFRTMCVDAEQRFHEIEHLNEVSGPVFKIKNDPRITRLGRILRKTSIDELPQLLNVLVGDMSLVGPRPLSVRDYELMTAECQNWQRCRFSVCPGITCLWQIKGRNSIPFEQWMELDREYVLGWSLWLDFEILLRTIPVVIKGSGAA